jgi:hypothetical protein
VKSHILLRIASLLSLLHALLNTFAGLLSGTSKKARRGRTSQRHESPSFRCTGVTQDILGFLFRVWPVSDVQFTANIRSVVAARFACKDRARKCPSIHRIVGHRIHRIRGFVLAILFHFSVLIGNTHLNHCGACLRLFSTMNVADESEVKVQMQLKRDFKK